MEVLRGIWRGWQDVGHSIVCWWDSGAGYSNSDFWDYLGIPDSLVGNPEDVYPTPWTDIRKYW